MEADLAPDLFGSGWRAYLGPDLALGVGVGWGWLALVLAREGLVGKEES